MEQTGIRKVFERSEEKHKIHYTKHFGDGGGEAFAEVENAFEAKGFSLVKMGHVVKRVGSALRKLKKSTKGLGEKGKLTNAMVDRL